MKKILLLSREFPPSLSGVSIAVYNYIKDIKSFKFDVLSFFDTVFSNEYITVKRIGSPKKNKIWNAFTYMILSFFDIFSSIWKSNGDYDCIVGNAFIGSAAAVISKKMIRKPLLSIIYDVDYADPQFKNIGRVNKFVRKTIYNSIFANSDSVITTSKIVKDDIIRIFGEKTGNKVKVIPVGIELEPFGKMDKPKGKKIILFASQVKRNKGIEYLIEAFKTVSQEIKNSELWIVGTIIEKDYYDELIKQASNLNVTKNVKFLGPVKHYDKKNVVGFSAVKDSKKINPKELRKNIFSYYDACDVFVASSYHSEKFGIPCVEASLMGKPIVATDVFEENGVVINNKTALVVQRQNSKELADAIIKVLKDEKLQKKLGDQGREFGKKFETTALSKEFENRINELI